MATPQSTPEKYGRLARSPPRSFSPQNRKSCWTPANQFDEKLLEAIGGACKQGLASSENGVCSLWYSSDKPSDVSPSGAQKAEYQKAQMEFRKNKTKQPLPPKAHDPLISKAGQVDTSEEAKYRQMMTFSVACLFSFHGFDPRGNLRPHLQPSNINGGETEADKLTAEIMPYLMKEGDMKNCAQEPQFYFFSVHEAARQKNNSGFTDLIDRPSRKSGSDIAKVRLANSKLVPHLAHISDADESFAVLTKVSTS